MLHLLWPCLVDLALLISLSPAMGLLAVNCVWKATERHCHCIVVKGKKIDFDIKLLWSSDFFMPPPDLEAYHYFSGWFSYKVGWGSCLFHSYVQLWFLRKRWFFLARENFTSVLSRTEILLVLFHMSSNMRLQRGFCSVHILSFSWQRKSCKYWSIDIKHILSCNHEWSHKTWLPYSFSN